MRFTVLFMTVLVLAIAVMAVFFLLDPFAESTGDVNRPTHPARASTESMVSDLTTEDSSPLRKDLPTRREESNRARPDGPVISGTLTDRLTGKPAPGVHRIELWEGSRGSGPVEKIEVEQIWCNDEGEFAIPVEPLPLRGDRRYNLVLEQWDHVIFVLENLSISPTEGLTGLDIRLEPKGQLELVCRAFEKNDYSDLATTLVCATRTASEVFWKRRSQLSWADVEQETGERAIVRQSKGDMGRSGSVDPDGMWTAAWDLEPGLWSLIAGIGNQRFETDLTIVSGRTTRIELHRQEIVPALVIAGSMSYTNGVPVVGAELVFSARSLFGEGFEDNPIHEPGYKKKQCETSKCVTDEKGKFQPLDLVPGTWRLRAYLADGSTPFFHDIEIPLESQNPYPLDLVVHRGSVSGTLCDQTTRMPFETDYTRWFIVIRDCATGEVIADHGNRFGSAFNVACVPPGRHQIEVRAREYVDFISAPFTLAAGQDLDLGEIEIAGQDDFGSLLLTLTDGAGQPFEQRVEIEVLKDLGLPSRWQILPWGEKGCTWEWLGWHSYRLGRLPAERLTIRIKENKKILREATVTIESGKEATKTLSLDPP